jgi:hypothetical protein
VPVPWKVIVVPSIPAKVNELLIVAVLPLAMARLKGAIPEEYRIIGYVPADPELRTRPST